jgi:hypothetical protein
MTIHPQTLTLEKQQRLNLIEYALLELAPDAGEETRTKSLLKGK